LAAKTAATIKAAIGRAPLFGVPRLRGLCHEPERKSRLKAELQTK
jgi:hypothetical protein